MKYAFSILMFALAACLLLYSGLIALSKDVRAIPRRFAVKTKDNKAYAVRFSKVLCIAAIAPVLSGLTELFSTAAAGVVLAAGLFVCIWIGTALMKS